MFKEIVLRCILPVIIGVPFIGQHGATEIFGGEAITATEIAQEAGYPAESYDVITQDGYILRIDRIVGSKKSPPSDNKTTVLLLHGLLDASPTWLVAGPENSLGFMLADEGYDVWLGNVRGTRYSRRNLNLTTSDSEFWNFSWNEMGIYDVPAMIDHIVDQTKQEKIFMASHSQGTTAFFVMASERPEYQEKIIAFFALAPVAFLSRMKNLFVYVISIFTDLIYTVAKLLGIYEIPPSNGLVQWIGGIICRDGSLLQPLCIGIFELIGGRDENFNTTVLSLVMEYWPAGCSVKQLAHYGQLIHSGKFRKYDYGRAGNIENYNETNPPDYNLRNMILPVYLHYSRNDVFADVADVLKLHEILPNAQKFLVPCDVFAHFDFVWGKNVNILVYDKVLRLMEHYRK